MKKLLAGLLIGGLCSLGCSDTATTTKKPANVPPPTKPPMPEKDATKHDTKKDEDKIEPKKDDFKPEPKKDDSKKNDTKKDSQ